MERNGSKPTVGRGLGERVLREVLRTPPLKEILVLNMREIDPETAPGLVRTFLWEDPGVSLSLIGALSDWANWTAELLLELGRQLNGFPEPLLADFISRIGEGVDSDRLRLLAGTYGELLEKFVLTDERSADWLAGGAVRAANASIAAADRITARMEEKSVHGPVGVRQELDARGLGRVLARILRMADRAREGAPVTRGGKARAFLTELEPGRTLSSLARLAKGVVSAGFTALAWGLKSLLGGKTHRTHEGPGAGI